MLNLMVFELSHILNKNIKPSQKERKQFLQIARQTSEIIVD